MYYNKVYLPQDVCYGSNGINTLEFEDGSCYLVTEGADPSDGAVVLGKEHALVLITELQKAIGNGLLK